jgi:hypothetical protein
MFKRLKARLTYANVMATIAVFIALGSGAYAVKLKKHSVGTKQLKGRAVTERKIADSAVTAAKLAAAAVTAAKLADGSVNAAKVADGSIGLADVNSSLHQICPAGTVYLEGACIETAQRTPAIQFQDARAACGPSGRLPSVAELDAFGRRPGVSWPGFEWTTGHFRVDPMASDSLTTVNDAGALGINNDSNSGFAPFRCVFEPTG